MRAVSKWLETRRMEKVAPFLTPPVLDVGCGSCVASGAGPEAYVGIDLDREPLLVRPSSTIAVTLGSAQDLPFAPNTFQTVLLMASIEHLPDPQRSLAEAVRVLMPGGRVVVTTPTPAGDTLHHLLAQVGITSRHAADEHQSILSGDALQRTMRDAGLVIETYRPFLLGGNQVCVGRRPCPDTTSGQGDGEQR